MKGNLFLLVPVLWPMAGALAGYILNRHCRKESDTFLKLVPFVELAVLAVLCAQVTGGLTVSLRLEEICEQGLAFVLDETRALLLLSAALLWTTAFLASREETTAGMFRGFSLFMLGTLAGLLLSADLFTMFLFLELLALSSFGTAGRQQRRGSARAADGYLAVQIISGMVFLMGLFLVRERFDTTDFAELAALTSGLVDRKGLYLPGILLLTGFAARAGLWPLHVWLAPVGRGARPEGAALLLGITAQSGLFGIALLYVSLFLGDTGWMHFLTGFGVLSTLWGGACALLSGTLSESLSGISLSLSGLILACMGAGGALGWSGQTILREAALSQVIQAFTMADLFYTCGLFAGEETENAPVPGTMQKHNMAGVLILAGCAGIVSIPVRGGLLTGPSLFLVGGVLAACALRLAAAHFSKTEEEPAEKAASGPCRGLAAACTTAGVLFFACAFGIADAVRKGIFRMSASQVLVFTGIGLVLFLCAPRAVRSGKKSWTMAERIYRPLIGKILPAAGGAIARLADALPERAGNLLLDVGTAAARFVSCLTEWACAFLTRVLLKPLSIPKRDPLDYEPDDMLSKSHESRMSEDLTGRLSFGLLLFGLGFCATMLYLIFVLFS